MVKAIVLAGGFATRLRPLTLTRPKPLLPILDKPLLDWIINSLYESGIKEIILSIRYLAHLIKAKYGAGIDRGVDIKYVEETKPLGDAGPLRLVDEVVGLNETFLVVYGDVFSDVDYSKLLSFHKRKGGIATIMLTRVDDPSRYGVAILNDDHLIKDFVEKPPREKAPSNIVNAGIYVFEPEVIKYIPSRKPSKLARDVIPRLVEEGQVYGYIYEGLWNDIGVPEDYYRANMRALKYFYPQGHINESAEIDPSAEIIQPVYISGNVKVEKSARIGPFTIIGEGTKVGEYAYISNSIVFPEVIIEPSAVIRGAIIGERSIIGRWSRLENGVIVGDEVVIDETVLLNRGVIILPFKEVSSSIYDERKIIL